MSSVRICGALRRAAALLATTAIVFVASSAPASALPSPDFFALNAQPMIKLGFVPPDRWGAYLDSMAAGGIRVARVDAGWRFAEPTAPSGGTHTYLWDRPSVPTQSLDLLAREFAARGIRMLPVIATAPPWAGGSGTAIDPSRYGDFAAFAGAFAARYGSRGSFWAENPGLPYVPPFDYEIWTEANSANMWTGRADADAYMAALPGVSQAVRGADPSGRVLASVGWQGFEAFVRELYARGGGDVTDGIAFHPYAPHAPAIVSLVVKLRQLLVGLGDPNAAIEVTETGQPAATSGPGGARAGSGPVSDAARAATQSLTGDVLARSNCGVGAFNVYSLVSSETMGIEPAPEPDMGVLRLADAQPNVTGTALFAASQRWRAAPRDGLKVCGSGPTAPKDLLGLKLGLKHTTPTCATGTVTYEGNPIEAANLVLRTADGRSSTFEVDAFGKGEVCIPNGPPIWSFDVRAEIENMAASGTYRCPVEAGDCVLIAEGNTPVPTPPGAGCRWHLKPRVVAARGARARVFAALNCAPKATRIPFSLSVRRSGGAATTSLAKVTVRQGTMRTVTLPRRVGVRDRVVVDHPANAKTGVPKLSAVGRTTGGATATGSEGCEWKVETRVVRRSGSRTRVRIRVACIPPGARTVPFVASVRRKGASKSTRVRSVTLATGREQTFALRVRLRRGDRIELVHDGNTTRGTPRIAARATVSRSAAVKRGRP
ncbi:MAG: hypothetical protein JHC95_02365 [Solirubrobacteraceae bacterium]|nr:hypothetical protein [Solirubrobacteraceae bacterium]